MDIKAKQVRGRISGEKGFERRLVLKMSPTNYFKFIQVHSALESRQEKLKTTMQSLSELQSKLMVLRSWLYQTESSLASPISYTMFNESEIKKHINDIEVSSNP